MLPVVADPPSVRVAYVQVSYRTMYLYPTYSYVRTEYLAVQYTVLSVHTVYLYIDRDQLPLTNGREEEPTTHNRQQAHTNTRTYHRIPLLLNRRRVQYSGTGIATVSLTGTRTRIRVAIDTQYSVLSTSTQ